MHTEVRPFLTVVLLAGLASLGARPLENTAERLLSIAHDVALHAVDARMEACHAAQCQRLVLLKSALIADAGSVHAPAAP